MAIVPKSGVTVQPSYALFLYYNYSLITAYPGLFPFGEQFGDTLAAPTDGDPLSIALSTEGPVTIATPIVLFGRYESSLYVRKLSLDKACNLWLYVVMMCFSI